MTAPTIPNPQQIATVTSGGQNYAYWKSIECSRIFGTGVCDARLSVAEFVNADGVLPTAGGFANLKLKPGDLAQISLGGKQIIDGYVWSRQGVLDPENHGVEIGIASTMLNAIVSSVDASPGQYVGYNIQQIGSAVLGKVGVNFNVLGSPSGAGKVFPRVSEHVGETRWQFIERLCRMRNLHLCDDGQGNLNAFRSPTEGVIATLTEGQNIKRSRVILKNNEMYDPITTVGQSFGNNQAWGDTVRGIAAMASAQSTLAAASLITPGLYRPMTIAADHIGDAQDMAYYCNHVRDYVLASFMDAVITVPGWFMADGSLWWDHVATGKVTLVSPRLLPVASLDLQLKGVVCRQNDEVGTETDIILSNILGTGDPVTTYGGGAGDPTALGLGQPAPPDTGTGPG
jgi:prophage tail gpP-like protein